MGYECANITHVSLANIGAEKPDVFENLFLRGHTDSANSAGIDVAENISDFVEVCGEQCTALVLRVEMLQSCKRDG